MLAEQQIDLFAPPVELEIAAQLPEWFSIQQLADELGYESHFDDRFRQIWYRDIEPHLEERKSYIGGDERSKDYRGYTPQYRLKVISNEQNSIPING